MRLVVVLIVACGGTRAPPARSTDSCAGHDDRPKGSPSDYVPPELPGFVIASPVTCEHERGAYIRIQRTTGARKLGIARQSSGGFGEGCMEPPASSDDCPILNWGVPVMAAEKAMRARGLMVNGIGAGPCADIYGDFAAWNMSIGVTAWSEAATVLQLVAAEMDRYDVAGYLGVAVRGISCAVPE